jgi:hypothetical protein
MTGKRRIITCEASKSCKCARGAFLPFLGRRQQQLVPQTHVTPGFIDHTTRFPRTQALMTQAMIDEEERKLLGSWSLCDGAMKGT